MADNWRQYVPLLSLTSWRSSSTNS